MYSGSVRNLIKAIVFDLGNTLVRENSPTIEKMPHAVNVLAELRKKYKLAVISNVLPTTSGDKIREILLGAGLLDYFDEVVVSSEVGFSKPAEQIFKITLEKLNVKPEEAVMVGNIVSTDIFGGNGIGMKTVLLQETREYQRSSWEKPTHTIQSLEELLKLV
ncbi:MAG: HAD family hydrolase [Candidatus Bathyarchaeota archaeon]|nr:HAD family hydrolase [Candidatus Bathyarchaeota archaeon]